MMLVVTQSLVGLDLRNAFTFTVFVKSAYSNCNTSNDNSSQFLKMTRIDHEDRGRCDRLKVSTYGEIFAMVPCFVSLNRLRSGFSR